MQLKEFFFKISFFYKLIPVNFLMKLARKNILFPFYHFVDSGNNNNIVNQLYKPKTEEQFIEDIKFFKKHLTSLSITDLKSKRSGVNEYGFFLSFDDGLSNFYKVVAPILLKEKVYAINFLNSNFIDNKKLFYRYKVNLLINSLQKQDLQVSEKQVIQQLFHLQEFNKKKIFSALKKITIKETNILNQLAAILKIDFSDYLKNEKPYLCKKQILELIDKGFFFGAHSKNHPRYALISVEDQLKETLESVKEIEEQFNIKNLSFSFPFSDDGVSKEFFEKIAHHKMITFGTAGLKDESIENHFQRIPMEYNSIYSAETIVKGELIYYVLKRFFGRHKKSRN